MLFLRLFSLALAEGNLRRTRQIVTEELDPRASTLDVPCGPGLLADLFARADYVGCDGDRSDVDAARMRRPGIFVCSEPDRIGVPDERFAQVLARGLFDAVGDGLARATVRELARVMVRDGRLLVIGTLPVTPRAIAAKLATRLAGARFGPTAPGIKELLRPHFIVVSAYAYRSGFVSRVAVVARKAPGSKS